MTRDRMNKVKNIQDENQEYIKKITYGCVK